MYQDYFEELPEVIDDDNRITFETINSIDDAEKRMMIPYYCSLCGKLFTALQNKLYTKIWRKEDHRAIVVDRINFKFINHKESKILVTLNDQSKTTE